MTSSDRFPEVSGTSQIGREIRMRMPITEERPRFILNLKINDLINARYSTHL